MATADFEIGDLVWAKMKSYPLWPGKIHPPPQSTKSSVSRKTQHYVFFFGTENCAWIPDQNIVHHSEELVQSASTKKKTKSLKLAIDKIVAQSKNLPIESMPPAEEEDESELNTESLPVSISEKRVSKSKRKSKYESAKQKYFATVQKKYRNKYSSKMQKNVRKKYFGDQHKTSMTKKITNVELKSDAIPESDTIPESETIPASEPFLESDLIPFVSLSSLMLPNKKEIGFVGLGKIGQRIARKLLESGHFVTVWNRTEWKCHKFVRLGARQALNPCDVIAICDVTFGCVKGVDAVKDIVFGPSGILRGFERTSGKGYVELSTIDSKTSQEIAEAIEQEGGSYLEAAVTEVKKYDADESLMVICAGDYKLFQRCESCFFAFTKDTFYLSGIVGNGANMNLLTNTFMNTNYAALAEALALIQKSNLSVDIFLDLIKAGPLNSSLIVTKGKAIASGELFESSAYKDLQRDLSMGLDLADSCEQPMPLAAAANELLKRPEHLLHEPKYATSRKSTTED